MKVILKDNLENLGSFGDVVKVAEGYARNYLIPRGFAAEASRENLKNLDAQKEAWIRKASRLKDEAVRICQELEKVQLSFKRISGDEDKLFGSVTSMDVEKALKEKGFSSVERKSIVIKEPIKSLGVFSVAVRLHPEVKAVLNITVEKE